LNGIEKLLANPRVTVRRDGTPEAGGACVVYWMQRAQRGIDNPALDVAIAAANELQRPVAVFFGLHPKYPNANLRHYATANRERIVLLTDRARAEFEKLLAKSEDDNVFPYRSVKKPWATVCKNAVVKGFW
jgi:deoxyribodipyrimidine photo-lyase